MKGDRARLAAIARTQAARPYNGNLPHCRANIQKIVAWFPGLTAEEADGLWCAAFVYHCVRLAGCLAWEERALADRRAGCHPADSAFQPEAGDLILFDNTPHDHIGIVLENHPDRIVTAEGNVSSRSCILERKKDGHIRAYLRLPDGFCYENLPIPLKTGRTPYESRLLYPWLQGQSV